MFLRLVKFENDSAAAVAVVIVVVVVLVADTQDLCSGWMLLFI